MRSSDGGGLTAPCSGSSLNSSRLFGSATGRPGDVTLSGSGSALEDEGHLDVDLVLLDLAVPELDPLLLDPGRGDAAQGLVGALEALADGVLEALRRGR